MLLFLKVFFTEFIAEMGDKTQLMLIALTSKYKLRDIIAGTAVAILVLNGLAVLAGGLVSKFIPDWLIKMIAAFAFLYFAASTIAGDDEDEEEEGGKTKIRFAPLAVFCTFFVAELEIRHSLRRLHLVLMKDECCSYCVDRLFSGTVCGRYSWHVSRLSAKE